MSDYPIWVVPADTWPTFNIDPDEFRLMLEQFDEYWPGAVKSLADTPYPAEDTQ